MFESLHSFHAGYEAARSTAGLPVVLSAVVQFGSTVRVGIAHKSIFFRFTAWVIHTGYEAMRSIGGVFPIVLTDGFPVWLKGSSRHGSRIDLFSIQRLGFIRAMRQGGRSMGFSRLSSLTDFQVGSTLRKSTAHDSNVFRPTV